MKYLILLTCIVAALATDEEPPLNRYKPHNALIHDQCVEQSGVTQDQVRQIRKMERSDAKEIHEYVLCVWTKSEFFSPETGHNVERIVDELTASNLDEAKARELATKCMDSNEQKSTPAEWAYRGLMCLADNKVGELLDEANAKKKNKISED